MKCLSKCSSAILALAILGIVSHGLILFTDYVIWDGWWYSHFIRNRSETPYLTRILREIGRPQDILFFLPFFATNDIALLSKIIGVAGWVLAALFQYGFLRTALSVSSASALAITACSLSAPFFPFCGELTYNMYIIAVALFWLAWWLTGMRLKGDSSGFAIRATAVLLFVLSFELNSHIAYLYAVGLFLVLFNSDLSDVSKWRVWYKKLLEDHWELILLPVVYWVWKTTCTPTHGYYATYNALKLNPVGILTHYIVFVADFVPYVGRLVYESGQLGAAAVLGIFGFILVRRRDADAAAKAIAPQRPGRLLAASTVLLLCSIFSYCAVDQPVLCDGWAARNTILINLPVGIMVVSGCAALGRATRQFGTAVVLVPVFLFIVAGVAECNRTTLRWQAFGAKQLAVRAGVRAAVDGEKRGVHKEPVNVVHLRDYFTVPKTLPWYPPIVWTYMVAPDDSEPTVFVVDTRLWLPDEVRPGADGRSTIYPPKLDIGPTQLRQLMEQTTQPYALTKIPLSGRTLNVVVMGGGQGTDGVVIGRKYLMRRLLDPSSLQDYIATLVKVVRYE